MSTVIPASDASTCSWPAQQHGQHLPCTSASFRWKSHQQHLLHGSRKVGVLGLPREGQVPVPLAVHVALLGGVGTHKQDGHSGLNSCGGRAKLQSVSLYTWPCSVREGCALGHAAVSASALPFVTANVHQLLLPRCSPGLALPQHKLSQSSQRHLVGFSKVGRHGRHRGGEDDCSRWAAGQRASARLLLKQRQTRLGSTPC